MIYIVPECNLAPPKHVARGKFAHMEDPPAVAVWVKEEEKGRVGWRDRRRRRTDASHMQIYQFYRRCRPRTWGNTPPLYTQLHSMWVWIQATAWCHHHDNIIWKKRAAPPVSPETHKRRLLQLWVWLIDSRLQKPDKLHRWQTAPWWRPRDRHAGCQTNRQANRQAGRQAGKHVLRQGRHTLDILASRLYCSPLHGEVLESLILQVWRITGTSLLLSDTFEMWLYKVIARNSGGLRNRHKAALQLLWVDMVSAINWNVRHF